MTRREPTLGVPAPPPLRAEAPPVTRAARPPRAPRRRRRGPSLLAWCVIVPAALVLLVLLAVLVLSWAPPPTTAFMLQSPTRPVQYQWVPASRISDTARRAAVAAEDQKFWTHDGFDFEAIEKAQAHNQRSKRRRGASTISQQTAKNLFLWPGGGYFRKGVEAGFTVLIETFWTKQRILEVYLNIAEFGPGIYGVEAASQAYFHKPAAQLSAGEAARLAAVLPSPRRWSAKSPGPYVQRRTGWILAQIGYGSRDGIAVAPEPEPPATGVEAAVDADNGSGWVPASAPLESGPGAESLPGAEAVPPSIDPALGEPVPIDEADAVAAPTAQTEVPVVTSDRVEPSPPPPSEASSEPPDGPSAEETAPP